MIVIKKLAEKIASIERRIAEEKGGFYVFALFLRKDAPNKWDLVASADWIEKDRSRALKYMADQLVSMLTPVELQCISRIVLLDPDNPAVKKINRQIQVKHTPYKVGDQKFFETVDTKDGYVITSGLSAFFSRR